MEEKREQMPCDADEEAVRAAAARAKQEAETSAAEKPAESGNAAGAEESAEAAAAQEESPEKEERAKKGEKDSREKKDPREEKIAELTDRLQRNLAEFDNFRKRMEREKTAAYDVGARGIIEKILPVLDNFERGLGAVPEEQKNDPFVQGVDMIYKQFVKTLTDLGLELIPACGEPFDPALHNAVMHVEDENLGENMVAEEFQKGYRYHGVVVRHSMVKVAN